MPEITARGVRFHVQTLDPVASAPRPEGPDAPDAPVVVFVHGLAVDNLSSFYYRLAGPVAAAGARAVLYDQRGHGLSERPPSGYGPDDAVADLFGVLDGLGIGRPVHLVSNSFGGVVALNAALTRPDRVAGLVMVESYGPAERPGVWTEPLLNTMNRAALILEYERLAAQFAAIGWRKRSRQMAVADALINHTSLLADLAAAEPVGPAGLATLRAPVLAVYGEHSDILTAGRLLAAHVPDCELHVLPGHAHTVLSDGTSDLLALMLPWLARRASEGTSDSGSCAQARSCAEARGAAPETGPCAQACGPGPDPGSRAGAREPICAGGAR
ncbi:alpha/beta fold hydrolase [Actinomadura harenae]|uniref:Alpha/beta hydrolase n=1 Tax=Actinomadura harenae TaxID=2483351 RepID=A0A3M2L044_9ACTN|nr:alpha/beta hydrolase [Actinomadura harenae]RMI31087.1 alpha/beta hydrolase [Actinomadura harenae]